jgi:hypothetical protein
VTDLDADPIKVREHRESVEGLAFSPDGGTLASSSTDTTVRLWNLADLGEVPVVLAHEAAAVGVAFSPDGTTLATGSIDMTVRLWDVRRPSEEPIILRGHADWVNKVAFSPDGTFLATASDDNTVRLWIARTNTLVEMVCDRVQRNLTLDEWERFVGPDQPYRETCPDLPAGEGVNDDPTTEAPQSEAENATDKVKGHGFPRATPIATPETWLLPERQWTRRTRHPRRRASLRNRVSVIKAGVPTL